MRWVTLRCVNLGCVLWVTSHGEACRYAERVPWGLERHYGGKDLHFITSSCYRRRSLLGTAARRDLFLKVLEQVRRRYAFVVIGYVVMPEHFHLLVSEPNTKTLSDVMRALKLSFARRVLGRRKRDGAQQELFDTVPERVWQHRFYDFNVCTEKKRIEKLRYLHRNPVKRGLVASPEMWKWSSFRSYALGEPGVVKINDCDVLKLKKMEPVKFGDVIDPSMFARRREKKETRRFERRSPTSRKSREVGHPKVVEGVRNEC